MYLCDIFVKFHHLRPRQVEALLGKGFVTCSYSVSLKNDLKRKKISPVAVIATPTLMLTFSLTQRKD